MRRSGYKNVAAPKQKYGIWAGAGMWVSQHSPLSARATARRSVPPEVLEPVPHPFHLYSMRQTIEEGFILDVLQNYMTYKAYYQLEKAIEDDPELRRTARAA
jgi:hypothetical protein